MKRAIAVLISGVLSSGAGAANLLEVYRDAIANDADFASARAERDAGQEKAVQGRAGLMPGIGLAANTTFNDATYATRDYRYNSNGYGAELSQPLFRMQNWVQYKQGQLQTGLATTRFELARQDLILRVAIAYFDVLNAQDALDAVRSLKAAAEQQLQLAKKSFEVGTVTITDVHEAQSRHDLASAQEIAGSNDLVVKRQTLARLVGKEPELLSRLRKGVTLERPQPDDMQQWVKAAVDESYSVQAQKLAAEIASREVDRNRAAHLPTVDVVARYNQANTGLPIATADRTTIRSIGLELNMPLFQGGALTSRDREAAALKLKADSDLESARRASALAARQAYLGVTSGMAQIKALEAAEISSRSALDANRLGYEVGVRINIDVLNAQSQLADTTKQLAKARYDTLLAQLQLEAAAGALDEEDVQRVNALLETAPD